MTKTVTEVAREVLDLTSYDAAAKTLDGGGSTEGEAVEIPREWANAIIDEAVDLAVEKTLAALRSGIKVIE